MLGGRKIQEGWGIDSNGQQLVKRWAFRNYLGRLTQAEQAVAQKFGSVLTIDDLSAYLKISKSTLYKLVQESKIPGQKVGRHWRFRKETIDLWLDRTHSDGTKMARGKRKSRK